MPTEQNWYLPEQIVAVRFYGHLTLEEIRQAFAQSAQHVESSSAAQVHFLHDWSGITSFPRNLMAIRDVLTVRVSNPRRIGWVVIYGAHNPVLRFLGDLIFQTFRIRCRICATQAEALLFLQRSDTTLTSSAAADSSKAHAAPDQN